MLQGTPGTAGAWSPPEVWNPPAKSLAGRSPETGTGTAAPAKVLRAKLRPAGGQCASRVPLGGAGFSLLGLVTATSQSCRDNTRRLKPAPPWAAAAVLVGQALSLSGFRQCLAGNKTDRLKARPTGAPKRCYDFL
jgi:hypothetical protein